MGDGPHAGRQGPPGGLAEVRRWSWQESPHALSLETWEESVPCALAWRRTKMGTHPSKMGDGWEVRQGGDSGWDSGLGDPGSLSQPLSEPQFLPPENPCNAGVRGVCGGGGAQALSGGAGAGLGGKHSRQPSLPCTSCSGHLSGSRGGVGALGHLEGGAGWGSLRGRGGSGSVATRGLSNAPIQRRQRRCHLSAEAPLPLSCSHRRCACGGGCWGAGSRGV